MRSNSAPALSTTINVDKVRVLSFDVTGTLLIHRDPIIQTYSECAEWSLLPNAPTQDELKPAFKAAYFEQNQRSPAFGFHDKISAREWWRETVKNTLKKCGRSYPDSEFDRYFRRVYQHFGSQDGYEALPDAVEFLQWASEQYSLASDNDDKYFGFGVITNTPFRTVETVLPMKGFHNYFQWFVCSQDIGLEKPDTRMFDKAYEQAKFWIPGLERDNILHIGDSLPADYCGAKAAGFQALLLDRSDNARVSVYQDWLTAPDYPGKTENDIISNTVNNFWDVKRILQGE